MQIEMRGWVHWVQHTRPVSVTVRLVHVLGAAGVEVLLRWGRSCGIHVHVVLLTCAVRFRTWARSSDGWPPSCMYNLIQSVVGSITK